MSGHRERILDESSKHEWDHGYPFSKCKRCAALDLGSTYKTPCRGWYYENGERVEVPASAA